MLIASRNVSPLRIATELLCTRSRASDVQAPRSGATITVCCAPTAPHATVRWDHRHGRSAAAGGVAPRRERGRTDARTRRGFQCEGDGCATSASPASEAAARGPGTLTDRVSNHSGDANRRASSPAPPRHGCRSNRAPARRCRPTVEAVDQDRRIGVGRSALAPTGDEAVVVVTGRLRPDATHDPKPSLRHHRR